MTRIYEDPSSDANAEPIQAEVEYVCRHEMVCTLEDLIDRRAGFLYWNAEKRLERLRYGAQVIRAELDLTEEEFEAQLVAYSEHLIDSTHYRGRKHARDDDVGREEK